MNKEQRLKFSTRFNNAGVKAPEYDGSIGNKNYTNTDKNKMTELNLAVSCIHC